MIQLLIYKHGRNKFPSKLINGISFLGTTSRLRLVIVYRPAYSVIFNGVLVSSTLTLPVNIFTWKKEKPCSPRRTKIFVARARIKLATFRILDRTF